MPRRVAVPVAGSIAPVSVKGKVELPRIASEFCSPRVIGIDMLRLVEVNLPAPPDTIVIVDVFEPTRVSEWLVSGGKLVIRIVPRQSVKSSVKFISELYGPGASSRVVVSAAVPVKCEPVIEAAHGGMVSRRFT